MGHVRGCAGMRAAHTRPHPVSLERVGHDAGPVLVVRRGKLNDHRWRAVAATADRHARRRGSGLLAAT